MRDTLEGKCHPASFKLEITTVAGFTQKGFPEAAVPLAKRNQPLPKNGELRVFGKAPRQTDLLQKPRPTSHLLFYDAHEIFKC
jgi:hypothetical protein